MTARELRADLVEDISEAFKERRYKNPTGEFVQLNVFPQRLPKREHGNDEDPFPYVIVRLDSGDIASQTDPHKIDVILVVGLFDDDLENQGDERVLEILEEIQSRYEAQPVLNGKFRREDPFSWALQDEESYPYFYGAAHMTWSTYATRRKVSVYV